MTEAHLGIRETRMRSRVGLAVSLVFALGLWMVGAGVATNSGAGVADDALASVDDVTRGLSPGRQPHVSAVSSQAELQSVYDDLARGGSPAEWSNYKGTVVRRPDGVEVGIRPGATSGGATVDIRLPDGTTQKIHIE
ncbi:MAG: hypothetical protein ACT4OX_06250 [Actinomycetota bacterium]